MTEPATDVETVLAQIQNPVQRGHSCRRPYSVLIATDTADIVGLAQAQLHKSVQG